RRSRRRPLPTRVPPGTRPAMTLTPRVMRIVVVALVACSVAPSHVAYPVARVGTTVDTLHGERVADPYRWLEDLGSRGTRAWLAGEGEVTRRWLAARADRPAIARALAAAVDYERTSPPKRRGTRWFYTRRPRGHGQPELVVADSLTGEPRGVV